MVYFECVLMRVNVVDLIQGGLDYMRQASAVPVRRSRPSLVNANQSRDWKKILAEVGIRKRITYGLALQEDNSRATSTSLER